MCLERVCSSVHDFVVYIVVGGVVVCIGCVLVGMYFGGDIGCVV